MSTLAVWTLVVTSSVFTAPIAEEQLAGERQSGEHPASLNASSFEPLNTAEHLQAIETKQIRRVRSSTNGQGVELLVLSTSQCPNCVKMEPILARLEHEGYPIRKVDALQDQALAARLGVQSVPAIFLVADNQVVRRVDGYTSHQTLTSLFSSIGYRPESRDNTSVDARQESRPQTDNQTYVADDSLSMPFRAMQRDTADGIHPSDRLPNRHLSSAYDRAMAATVRLKIEDSRGIGVGTGTMIHQAGDEALVLTCGHLFEDFDDRSRIMVEVGFPSQTYIVEGRLLGYEIEHHDTALVVITPQGPVETAQVALPSYAPVAGDSVFSIGCDHGADPTIRDSQIKAITEYGLEQRVIKYDVYGQPANGRSGGGLYTAGGQLIGVCNAMTIDVDEGIYAGMQSIHEQLRLAGLSSYFSDVSRLAANPTPDPVAQLAIHQPPRRQQPWSHSSSTDLLAQGGASGRSTPSIDATLVGNRGYSTPPQPHSYAANPSDAMAASGNDLEYIVLVRSRTDPTQMETVVVTNPSPEFLQLLRDQQANTTAMTPRQPSQLGHAPAPPRSQVDDRRSPSRNQLYQSPPQQRRDAPNHNWSSQSKRQLTDASAIPPLTGNDRRTTAGRLAPVGLRWSVGSLRR